MSAIKMSSLEGIFKGSDLVASVSNESNIKAWLGTLQGRSYVTSRGTGTYANGPVHGQGSVAFVGGVLLPDGRVLLVSLESAVIGLYDPVTNTYTNGPAHGQRRDDLDWYPAAFWGGVLLPDGRVLLVPYNRSSGSFSGSPSIIGLYDPITNTYTDGPSLSVTLSSQSSLILAFQGGILLPDGRVLLVPFRSGSIGLYNLDGTFTAGPGAGGCGGGVLLPDGRVVLVPHSSTTIGLYDPVTNTYTDGPAHERQIEGFQAGAFAGGVLLPDGRVLLVPLESTTIGLYDPSGANPDGTVTIGTYTNGPVHGRGSNAFSGGVLLPDGRVVLVPRNSTTIGLYDPVTNTYTNGPDHGRGSSAFIGGVLLCRTDGSS
jgi:hypothetical protein